MTRKADLTLNLRYMKGLNRNNGARESFNSSFAATLALAGSAVGLGNLWRFPYLMGENGGAAFILTYVILAAVICLPIMVGEFIIGRRSQANVFGAFKALTKNRFWRLVAVLALISVILILSFYSVVGGWSVEYFFKSLTFSFTGDESDSHLATMFSDFVSNPWKPLVFHTIFLGLTALIVVLGVKQGIEKFSKVMMPLLFLLVIAIAVRSMTIKGAEEGIRYIFFPDFSKIDSHTVMMALGQAFFSLSIGCGTVITYASYVKKEDSILKCCAGTALFDTLFAVIAGCAIMPAVFAFGISPSEGPGLVFVTLPHIFSQMPAGGILAIIFFFALLIAALTSSISLLEVVIAFMVEELHLRRKWAVVSSFAVFWILGALCSLSQGVLSDFTIAGRNIFDLFDYISANYLMLSGGLLSVIFVGWVLGPKIIRAEVTNEGTLKTPGWLLRVLVFLIKYIAPLGVLAIMIL